MNYRPLLLIALTLPLWGCKWMNDGEGLFLDPDDDYLDAAEIEALKIPEDLRSLENTDPFPIPPVAETNNPRFYPDRPPLPDAIYANTNRDEVRIQRIGDRRWLVIPEAPTTAWPKIKQFLAENAVPVVYDQPQNGRLNTEWLRMDQLTYRDVVRSLLQDARAERDNATGMERFLIRVEQGLQQQTTEVHVRHENNALRLASPDAIDTLDGVSSADTAAEAAFLNEVGAYIAAKVSEQTVSRVALQIGSSNKAELLRNDNNEPRLRLYLDRDRAWATLGQALQNAEVEVSERDRDAGTFDVTITDAILTGSNERGFICRITFSCNRAESHDLRINLESLGRKTYDVSISDQKTERLDPDLAQQVLVLIREFAS